MTAGPRAPSGSERRHRAEPLGGAEPQTVSEVLALAALVFGITIRSLRPQALACSHGRVARNAHCRVVMAVMALVALVAWVAWVCRPCAAFWPMLEWRCTRHAERLRRGAASSFGEVKKTATEIERLGPGTLRLTLRPVIRCTAVRLCQARSSTCAACWCGLSCDATTPRRAFLVPGCAWKVPLVYQLLLTHGVSRSRVPKKDSVMTCRCQRSKPLGGFCVQLCWLITVLGVSREPG